MALYTTELIDRKEVAAGTMAFTFKKPDAFEYKPGQHIDLTLIAPPQTDAEGNKRTFSLVSAPFEPHLMISTRMRDTAFKNVIKAAHLPLTVEIAGPSGDMILHQDGSKPAVFLAGGIGITPFMSMIKQAQHDNTPHLLYLFYSNRRPEDAPFLNELMTIAHDWPKLHLIPTMTDVANSETSWNGEQGYVTPDLIRRYVPTPFSSVYYLAGPPGMVASLRKQVEEMGVDTLFIRQEEFDGYE